MRPADEVRARLEGMAQTKAVLHWHSQQLRGPGPLHWQVVRDAFAAAISVGEEGEEGAAAREGAAAAGEGGVARGRPPAALSKEEAKQQLLEAVCAVAFTRPVVPGTGSEKRAANRAANEWIRELQSSFIERAKKAATPVRPPFVLRLRHLSLEACLQCCLKALPWPLPYHYH